MPFFLICERLLFCRKGGGGDYIAVRQFLEHPNRRIVDVFGKDVERIHLRLHHSLILILKLEESKSGAS